MKLSITAALLCATLFLSTASADDVRWNGQTYQLQTVTPVTVDAFGQVWPQRPITVLIPKQAVSANQTDVSEQPELVVPHVIASPQRTSRPDQRFAYARPESSDVRFADSARSYDGERESRRVTESRSATSLAATTTGRSSARGASAAAGDDVKPSRAVYLDSSLHDRRIF